MDIINGVASSDDIPSSLPQNLNLKRKSSSIIGNKEVQVLPWDRFSHWVHSILVVTFDIEMGQSIESVYPNNHVRLSQQDKTNICYLSFPDSNSGLLGDSHFHFRFRLDTSANKNNFHNFHQYQNLNQTSKSIGIDYEIYNCKTLSGLQVEKNFMFGYVFFRQVKDKSLKRGYFQKSVVLLSRFPFVSLFSYILGLVAVEFFTTGPEVIETACHDIDQWPLLVPGELLSLPILGHFLEVKFPIKIENYSLPIIYKKDLPSVPITLPPVHEVNLFKCLEPILIHIHLLWEMVLLNEPIVVIANLPNVCSELVQALVSTIWPLKYASDYRPFFTIHNSEFNEYSSKNTAPPGLIIGVTNPFFTKCLQHWPNIIKISDLNKNVQFEPQEPKEEPENSKTNKIKKTNNIKVVEIKPAVFTKFKPFLNKDKSIIKNILNGAESNRPCEAQSALLRRYFTGLTQIFMIPLERYFSTLMPLHRNIYPFKSLPKLKEFDAEEFMRSLKQAGPEATPSLKGDLPGLYRKFFNTLNFRSWLEQKKIEADKKLELLQIEILNDYDVNNWIKGKHEIEILDQYMNIKKKMDLIETKRIEASDQTRTRLKSILGSFVSALPEDVRAILK